VTVWTGDETLVSLIHGESGVGKTPVGHTSPAPRLILDSENGSKFIRGRKVKWNPMAEAPPAAGDWDTCVVQCRDFPVFAQAYEWLNSGQHCFRSATVDSITELQKRARDMIFESGVGQGNGEADDMNERRWGILLQKMEKVIRDFRDLTMHQTNPLQCITFLALTDVKKGKYRPAVQGSLNISLPGFVDVHGYHNTEQTDAGVIERRMLVQPTATHVAKDRTSQLPSGGVVGVYGPVVPGPINLSDLIDRIYTEPAA
jgi:hypothetical protein